MTDTTRESAWAKATRKALAEATPKPAPEGTCCPNCLAENRPGVHYVDVDPDGACFCNACCWTWTRPRPAA